MARGLSRGVVTPVSHTWCVDVCVGGEKMLRPSFSLIPRLLGRLGNETYNQGFTGSSLCSMQYGGGKPSHVKDCGRHTRA